MNITKSRILLDTVDKLSIEELLKEILIELKLIRMIEEEGKDMHINREDII